MTVLDRSDRRSGLRILLVDGDELHARLRALLGGQPWVDRVDAVHGPEAAETAAARLRPDVAVLASAPAVADDATCQRVRRASHRTRLLFVADEAIAAPEVARAAGAAGVASAGWTLDDLAGAVRMVALGMTLFPAARADAADALSEREHAVLRLMASGATNREIAERLYLSPHTVKDHTTSLYRKLNARNRAEAVARAQRRGLLD
jgi:DNA-binding NarL/FixJ family response regulator